MGWPWICNIVKPVPQTPDIYVLEGAPYFTTFLFKMVHGDGFGRSIARRYVEAILLRAIITGGDRRECKVR